MKRKKHNSYYMCILLFVQKIAILATSSYQDTTSLANFRPFHYKTIKIKPASYDLLPKLKLLVQTNQKCPFY